jgi:hypothetical protein
MTPQKTKLEIIEELFDNYYVKNPSKRAVFGRVCLYYDNDTGNKCAVGMCMLNDDTAKYHQEFYATDVESLNSSLNGEEEMPLDDILKEEYRGHDIDFWARVQKMHDRHYYWTEHGLTEDGLAELNKLKTIFV